ACRRAGGARAPPSPAVTARQSSCAASAAAMPPPPARAAGAGPGGSRAGPAAAGAAGGGCRLWGGWVLLRAASLGAWRSVVVNALSTAGLSTSCGLPVDIRVSMAITLVTDLRSVSRVLLVARELSADAEETGLGRPHANAF